jgi:uncharacterized protein
VLRINIFRTTDAGARPVILSIHPYSKDKLSSRRGKRWTYSGQYRILRQPRPVTFSALTGWEAPDPSWWTAQGFTVVNADARGRGHSDGTGKLLSRQEAEDTYDLVQWIAAQPWCDGNVVMLGVSYLAISQYAVAALQPPALRAICLFRAGFKRKASPACGVATCIGLRGRPTTSRDARGASTARRLLALAGA